MISRSSLGRGVQVASRSQCRVTPSSRRGLAAPASVAFQYESGDAAGVRYAARALPGPTTTLAVVAKAGTRYEARPGFTEGLEKFAFKVRRSLPQSMRVPKGKLSTVDLETDGSFAA